MKNNLFNAYPIHVCCILWALALPKCNTELNPPTQPPTSLPDDTKKASSVIESPPKNQHIELTQEYLLGSTQEKLDAWFKTAKSYEQKKSFGTLLSKIAYAQVKKPYFDPPQSTQPEKLQITLETFQCVSFIETSLALARCIWGNNETSACFTREVAQSRYRDGELDGYASRLHYFFDWLSNNADRNRLKDISRSLGAKPFQRKNKAPLFSIMTNKPNRYPALLEPSVFAHIQTIENSLNQRTPYVLRGPQIPRALHKLKNGDIVAVVTIKRGLLISHTGFVYRTPNGMARLLHASSFHKRVVLTKTDIADYIKRDPKRIGILVFRPVAPASN